MGSGQGVSRVMALDGGWMGWPGSAGALAGRIFRSVERFGASALNYWRAGQRGLVDPPGGLPTYEPMGRRGRRRSQGDRGASPLHEGRAG
ncbi:MAG: hypothetical protein DWI69_10335 [Chloroflexi bacterium]|nr:MAG: hypothetical protein DWI69_10335 [Chloroflexota bacterium]